MASAEENWHTSGDSDIATISVFVVKLYSFCLSIAQENIENIKNVKRCRDGMPKSMQTR